MTTRREGSGIAISFVRQHYPWLILAALLVYVCVVQMRASAAEEAHRNSPEGRAEAALEEAKAKAEFEIDLAETFVRNRLREPSSAEFLGSRVMEKDGKKGVCGFVNAKNGFGRMSGNEEFAVIDMTTYLSSEEADTSSIVSRFCHS